MRRATTNWNATVVAGFGLLLALTTCGSAPGAVLKVGSGGDYARPEEAVAAAQPGDVIEIHPRADNAPYKGVAVLVRTPGLTIRGVPAEGEATVPISGEGFTYSGRGSTPRAIFQFNPGADGCVLSRLELFGAHNSTHNGAGVRINQANRVTIEDCDIHDNDMGVMSNGDGTLQRGRAQVFRRCRIHHNGDFDHPGYNHNLYLGGTSVLLQFCEIHHSLTGHNVKSRAHQTWAEYCYIHDSANREFDLVDAADTAAPASHAVLLGNIIVKDPQCRGNRAVIHFGQDGGGDHDGTIFLAYNTILTPFISPVVELSAPKTAAHWYGNLVTALEAEPGRQRLVAVRNGASLDNVTGRDNWFDGGFADALRAGFSDRGNVVTHLRRELFVDRQEVDFTLRPEIADSVDVRPEVAALELPELVGFEDVDRIRPLGARYRHPAAGGKPEDDGTALPGAVR